MKKFLDQFVFEKVLRGSNILIVGFFLVRLLPFIFYLANFGVQIAPDSGTYRYGYLNWDVLSDGHRGPGITLPFTLMPNDLLIVILQFSMVTFAGIFLIRELNHIGSNFKFIAIIAVFAVLNSPTVAIWDVWLLSHSLSIAYNIFSFTFLLKYSRLKNFKYLYAFGIFIFLSSVSRPNNQVVLILILTFIILQTYMFGNWRNLNDLKPRILLTLLLTGLILISVGVNSHLEKKWSPKLPVAILPYILDTSVPISGDIIKTAKNDPRIPDCAFPSEPLLNDNGNYMKGVYANCPTGVIWLENNFKEWYLKFLLTEPKSTLKAIGFGTTVGLGYPTNYGDTFPTVIPEPILKLFLGAPKVRNEVGSFPLFGWVLMAFFTSILVLQKKNIRGVSRSTLTGSESKVLLVAWLTSACIGIIYQSHGDNFRVFVDNQVIITIIATYLVSINISFINELSRSNESTNKFQ
jgi:hypothetical protein